MAKGHTGRTIVHQMDTEVSCIAMEEFETLRLNLEEPDQALAS
jgi:hypothetical protein